jgi:hypothetical protein
VLRLLVPGTLAAAFLLAPPLYGAPVAPGAPTAPAGGGPSLRWKDRSYALEELPPELGEAPRIALEPWSEWCAERRYRLDLVDDQRVLLITPREDGQPARELALVDRVLRLFDEIAPPVPEAEREALGLPPAPPLGRRKPETHPADGQGKDDGAGGDDEAGEPWSWTWSTAELPDTKTCVLIALRDEDDYRATLELLGREYAYLASWVKGAKGLTGYSLEDPLVGTWALRAAGQEEWSPDAALVHHAAQLLLARRFGTQPYWLVRGFAWTVEHELLDGHWYFPYRTGFVYAAEHSAWESMLAEHAEKRGAFEFDDLAGYARGSWNQEYALRSWGAVRWMRHFGGRGLPAALEHLRVERWDHGRTVHEDGSWHIVPGYEVSAEVQQAILAQHLGPDFLREVQRFCEQKKAGYRPPKD